MFCLQVFLSVTYIFYLKILEALKQRISLLFLTEEQKNNTEKWYYSNKFTILQFNFQNNTHPIVSRSILQKDIQPCTHMA